MSTTTDQIMAEFEKKQKEWEKLIDNMNTDAPMEVDDVFTIGVADGKALYQVTEIGKDTCKIVLRDDLCEYSDHWLEDGGVFPKRKIEQYVMRQKQLSKLFAPKK